MSTYILCNVTTQYNTVLHIDMPTRVLRKMGKGFQWRDIAKVIILEKPRG